MSGEESHKTQQSGIPTPKSPAPSSTPQETPSTSLNIDISKYLDQATDALKATMQTPPESTSVNTPTNTPTSESQNERGIFVSETSLKRIVTEVIESALANFVAHLKEELNSQTKMCIEKVEGSVHDIGLKAEHNEKAIHELERKVSESEQNAASAIRNSKRQHERIRDMRNSLNDIEQYSRRSHIRLIGVVEKPKETPETLMNTVKNILASGYKLPLRDDDIEVCHRTGQSRQGRPRHIIVRFLRRGIKDQLFVKKKHFRLKGIQVVHDLTQANSRLLYDVKHHERIDTAWVAFTGKIMAKGVNGHVFHVDLSTDINHTLDSFNIR